MNRLLTIILIGLLCLSLSAQRQEGYFPIEWDEEKGLMMMEISAQQIGESFLYVGSLSAGVGSNDIGLDRGQLGQERVVRFDKIGPKILLVQENLDYRAESDNALEQRAVREAFAASVLWGFDVKDSEGGTYKIDVTPFLMNDMHNVAQRLKSAKQGTYKVDKKRSAVWTDRCRAFPDNTELEAPLTQTP